MKSQFMSLVLLFAIPWVFLSSCGGAVISSSQQYTFGTGICSDCILNPNGDKLYVSYMDNNKIFEIDPVSMTSIREIQVQQPLMMEINSAGDVLYTITAEWPGRLACTQLSTGQTEYVQFDGGTIDLVLDEQNDRLWVLHGLFPTPTGINGIEEACKPENQSSGRLSVLQLSTMNVLQTTILPTTPDNILYSPYSQQLYVAYDIWYIPTDFPEGCLLEIRDSQNYEVVSETAWGEIDTFGSIPIEPTFWSDDGRYLAYPSPFHYYSAFSMRVIDTATDTVAFDITMPATYGSALSPKFSHKVPGLNILWADVQRDVPPGFPDEPRTVVRIDTSSQQYQFFQVEGSSKKWGDFAVSPDGETLYLTVPHEGGIFKFTTPNTPPVAQFDIVTQMPYIGPSPAAIEFNASGSRDNDPCDELTYEWDFDGDMIFSEPVDDSYTGDPVNPTHNYTSDYTGPVNLRVTDNHSASSTYSRAVVVDIQ
jgi:DNA-binding beta-propeller fold protein YncE